MILFEVFFIESEETQVGSDLKRSFVLTFAEKKSQLKFLMSSRNARKFLHIF